MPTRPLMAVGLFVGCVAAAGAGGYLAVRQASRPAQPVADMATAPVASAAPATEPVVLTTEADLAVPDPAPRVEAPIARRPETPVRPSAADSVARPVARPVARAARPAPPVTPTPPTLADATSMGAVESIPTAPVLAAPEPPAAPVRQFDLVTLPEDSVIGVQLETTVSTATARVEDAVRARVTRDVLVGGVVAVPAGSRLFGYVTLVEEGGRVKEASRIGIRFRTLVLTDGREVGLDTATIYRGGESPAGRTAARVGGAAAAGSIIGAILGGGRGAAIGAATGAGAGGASAMTAERRPAELRAGQPITVRLASPTAIEIER